jgi:hypothetical protein
VCPSNANLFGSFPNSSASTSSNSCPSLLIFALPLSENVPVADSVSSIRKPSFVTCHIDVILQQVEIWNFPDGFLELFLQLLHLVLGDDKIFGNSLHIAADLIRRTRRILEISPHCLLYFLAAFH